MESYLIARLLLGNALVGINNSSFYLYSQTRNPGLPLAQNTLFLAVSTILASFDISPAIPASKSEVPSGMLRSVHIVGSLIFSIAQLIVFNIVTFRHSSVL